MAGKEKHFYWLQWIFFSITYLPSAKYKCITTGSGHSTVMTWDRSSIEPLSDYSFRKDKKEKNTVNTDFTQKLLTTFNVRVIITNSPTFFNLTLNFAITVISVEFPASAIWTLNHFPLEMLFKTFTIRHLILFFLFSLRIWDTVQAVL